MQIIISFTSYPARISTLDKVLTALCSQTILPDRTVLYLAESQFPQRKVDINTDKYASCCFEIHWCPKDLKSYKKFYYAMQEYPDDLIITIDDDFNYSKTLVEELLTHHKKYPSVIIARRGSKITFKDSETVSPYEHWYTTLLDTSPCMDNFATTGGGTLYPPHLLSTELFNDKTFMKLAPHADDLWMKTIELLSCVPVAFSSQSFNDFFFCNSGLYSNYNGNDGNDRQLKALMDWYEEKTGESMLHAIQKDGCVQERDLYIRNRDNVGHFFLSVLNKYCGDCKFYAFGAGRVAHRFNDILFKLNLEERLIGFLVSDTTKEKDLELKVCNLSDTKVNEHQKVIICVNLLLHPEVESLLCDSGIPHDSIVIFPPEFIPNVHKGLFWTEE